MEKFKQISFVVLAAIIVTAIALLYGYFPDKPTIKTVVAKEAPMESRYNWYDDRFRAQTVHYLIAEDGTILSVDVGTYAITKVGDKVQACWGAK